MKKCIDCQQEKPATAEFFNRRSKSSDGLNCYCKDCLNARQRRLLHAKRMLDPEYAAALDRKSRGVRQCTKCLQEKPATSEFFHSRKHAHDGCREVCRICRAADHAENRAERLAARKLHYVENRDRLNAISKSYYRSNIEAQRASARARHHRNRDDRLAKIRAYHEAHREELNVRNRRRNKAIFQSRYRVDVGFTLRHRVGSLLRISLRNGRKSRKMAEILEYTTDELRVHLERQFVGAMSWEHFMRGEIHIDHIKPVSRFNITSDHCDDFKSCWALSNLRPMWAKDNLSKGAKSVEEYEKTRVGHKL